MTHIEAFIQWLRVDGRSAHTIRAYEKDLVTLSAAVKMEDPDQELMTASRTDLVAAVDSSMVQLKTDGSPRAASSIQRIKSSLRAFFNWAEDMEHIEDNPAKIIRIRRLPRNIPEFLSEKEKRKLLKEVRSHKSFIAFRDRVMIEIFLGTGIRLKELVNLDLDHVDLERKHLHILAKNEAPQVKFIKSNLRTLLRQYLKTRRRYVTDEDQALFLSNRKTRICPGQVENRVKFWISKAGIQLTSGPHMLRHTFATHLYKKAGDLLIVKEALGHANLSSTVIYTHLASEDLEEAIERL